MGVFVCRAATAIVLPPRGWRRCLLTCWPALRLCTPWKYQVTLPTSPFFFFIFFFCIVSTFWRLWRFRWGGGAKCFRKWRKEKTGTKGLVGKMKTARTGRMLWSWPESDCSSQPVCFSLSKTVLQSSVLLDTIKDSLQCYLTLWKTLLYSLQYHMTLSETLIQSLVLLDAIRLLYSL